MGKGYAKISPELLLGMLTEGNVISATVTKGFPVGAKLVKAGYSDFDFLSPACFYLTVEHESIVEQEGVVPEPMLMEITKA